MYNSAFIICHILVAVFVYSVHSRSYDIICMVIAIYLFVTLDRSNVSYSRDEK